MLFHEAENRTCTCKDYNYFEFVKGDVNVTEEGFKRK